MQHTTLNRRHSSSVRRQRQRQQLLLLPLAAIVTLFALVELVASAPVKRSTGLPYNFNTTQALLQASSTWKLPCGQNRQGEVVHDASFNKSTKFLNMERQINLTLLDLSNWRILYERNSIGEWNNNDNKRKFKFLQPFVRNESSWERRLSVYWAHLKLIRMFHENHTVSTNIKRDEADALETVNEATRQLLCMVQEYRQATKRENKTIEPKNMERMINFTIPPDASEIKIDIWYVMCRLECYLTNMRKHLRQLRKRGGNRPHKQINLMSCKTCPYCKFKQCNTDKNKHRQQQQQQQQQLQQQPPHQRKHNRAGHNSQPKQTKHQQQKQKPSRQPKGRKGGTRMPKNHARKQQRQQQQQQQQQQG